MLAEHPQHAFSGVFKDVVRHAVIEVRVEPLSDALNWPRAMRWIGASAP